MIPAPAAAVPAVALEAMAAAKAYARDALAPETKRAYAADWAHFTAWCQDAGCAALPAEPGAVAAYLAALAGLYSRSALERRLGGRLVSTKRALVVPDGCGSRISPTSNSNHLPG